MDEPMGHSSRDLVLNKFIDVPDSGVPQFHSLERFSIAWNHVIDKAELSIGTIKGTSLVAATGSRR
jgi:hypothetical protein